MGSRARAYVAPQARQPALGGDHRRRTVMNGLDDLSVVDPAQIHGGNRQVGVRQLSLDYEQRHPLA
jgi:hypothetical protein